MNFNERGITVGDLLLVIILVISTVLIINNIKKSDSQRAFNVSAIEMSN